MVVDKGNKTDNFIHKDFERQFHKKKMHPVGCIGFGSSYRRPAVRSNSGIMVVIENLLTVYVSSK